MSDLDEIFNNKSKNNNIYTNAMSELDVKNKTHTKPIKLGSKVDITPLSLINRMPFIQSNSAIGTNVSVSF